MRDVWSEMQASANDIPVAPPSYVSPRIRAARKALDEAWDLMATARAETLDEGDIECALRCMARAQDALTEAASALEPTGSPMTDRDEDERRLEANGDRL